MDTQPNPPELIDQMTTPLVVRAMLDRLPNLSAAQRTEYEREFKLSYYYEGLCVAVQATDRGPAVAASGSPDEVAAVLNRLTADAAARVVVVDPTPLAAIAAQLPRTKSGAAAGVA